MKTNILRSLALAVGLTAGPAFAQYANYAQPAYNPNAQLHYQNAVPLHPSLVNTGPAQSQLQGPPTQGSYLVPRPYAQTTTPVAYGQPTMLPRPNQPYPNQQYANPQYTRPMQFGPGQVNANPAGYPVRGQFVNNGGDDLLAGSAPATQPLPPPQPTPAVPAPAPANTAQPMMHSPAPQPMPQYDSGNGYSVMNGYNATPTYPSPSYSAPTYSAPSYSAPAPVAENPGCSTCNNNAGSYQPEYSSYSPYAQAAMGSWQGDGSCGPAPMPAYSGPVPARNWFGGSNVLLMNYADNCRQRLVFDVGAPSQTRLTTDDADFDLLVGGEFFAGRYFGCGRYALVGSYWFLNPNDQSTTITVPVGSDYNAHMPNLDRAYVDLNNDNALTAGEDMATLFNAATAYRVSRDMSFNNVELMVVGFGIGGAARLGVPGCNSGACGVGLGAGGYGSGACGNGACGNGACGDCNSCQPCAPARGCVGGPCGPLAPACSSRMRFTYGNGIRWLQFKDNFEFAASRAVAGYTNTDDDLYYNTNVTNDLLGYQFLGRLDYCLGHRLSMYASSKAGIYVNNIDFSSRLGTGARNATPTNFYPVLAGQNIMVNNSDTGLAFLGELDLGANYNLTPCWTINGGYRIMGVSGVATAIGQMADDVANLNEAGYICSDKTVILHGAYIGATYNW